MGETEFLDLSSGGRNASRSAACEQDFFGLDEAEADFFNPGRAKFSDYKHNSSTIQKGGIQNDRELIRSGGQQAPSGEKKSISLGDEKIVWVGAIFVFFCVLVFMIGLWLGKVTMKDVGANSHSYNNQKMEEKFQQKKLENNYALNQTPLLDNNKNNETVVPPVNITPVVSSSSSAPSDEDQQKVQQKETVKETVKDSHKNTTDQQIVHKKVDTKNVKLQTTKDTNVQVNRIKTDNVKIIKNTAVTNTPVSSGGAGDFTIQVSAHTSIEKARFIEDSLRSMGYQSYLVEATVNGVTYYRVRAGKFPAKKDAEDALQRIKASSLGKDSFIVSLR